MFKFLKDGKRRAVETVLSAVGKSETTVDADYNLSCERFSGMIVDLNDAGSAVVTALKRQDDCFRSMEVLSELLEKIYTKNGSFSSEDWLDATNDLPNIEGCKELNMHMKYINKVLRQSAQILAMERGTGPIAEKVTSMNEHVDAVCKERDAKVKDFDSYRRRLKDLNIKREGLETQNKPAADVIGEIAKFEVKRETAEHQFKELNCKAKSDILLSKKEHDKLVESLLIALVFSQSEFMRKSSLHLDKVLSLFPQEGVLAHRTRFQELVTSLEAKHITELGKVATLRPKAESDGMDRPVISFSSTSSMKRDSDATVTADVMSSEGGSFGGSLPIAVPTTASSDFTSDFNPFSDSYTTNTTINTNANRISSNGSSGNSGGSKAKAQTDVLFTVVTLYDNVPDDVDELAFKAGEIIEVLFEPEDEWWKGRSQKTGLIGVFPSNYARRL